MNKKVVILIVLCLLLAGGIAFIFLNPVQEEAPAAPTAAPAETAAPTEASADVTEAMAEVADAPEAPTEEAEVPQSTASRTEEPEPKPTEAEKEPAATQPKEPAATQPKATEPPATEAPTEPKPTGPDDYDNTGSNIGVSNENPLTGSTEYEKYMNMSEAEQQAYFNSYADPADFFAWYNKAKEEYEQSRDVIEVGPDATIDLGSLGN